MKILSVSLSIRLFTTSLMMAAAWISLEIPEATRRFWQNQLQRQQVPILTDDTAFIVDLPTRGISNHYANTGPDAK